MTTLALPAPGVPNSTALAKSEALASALAGALIAGDNLKPVRPPASDKHAPSVYLASLRSGSRRAMEGAIVKISHLLTGGRCDPLTMPWGALRWSHTMAVRAAVIEMFSFNYARKIVSALRGVLKFAWKLEQIKTEPYLRAIDIPSIKGENLLRGRALSPGEILALFASCAVNDGTSSCLVSNARDAAMFAVLYGAGLRRSECVSLDLADYNRETGELRVLGAKGAKDRLIYLGESGHPAIEQWLSWRGLGSGPLFYRLTRGGRIIEQRLHDQAVQDIITKRMRLSRVAHFSAHDLRRTWASHLLEAGADIATVQKLAGHKSPVTTARYDRRGESAKKRASNLIHIPFVSIEPEENSTP